MTHQPRTAMKAAIGIDHWKLNIFTRHLTEAGYAFENAGNLTPKILTLIVETDDVNKLTKVINAANTEARRTKSI